MKDPWRKLSIVGVGAFGTGTGNWLLGNLRIAAACWALSAICYAVAYEWFATWIGAEIDKIANYASARKQ